MQGGSGGFGITIEFEKTGGIEMTELEKAQNRAKQGEVAYAHLRKVIDALERERDELKKEISELRNQILDTGPMLPKNGITIRYTESEDSSDDI